MSPGHLHSYEHMAPVQNMFSNIASNTGTIVESRAPNPKILLSPWHQSQKSAGLWRPEQEIELKKGLTEHPSGSMAQSQDSLESMAPNAENISESRAITTSIPGPQFTTNLSESMAPICRKLLQVYAPKQKHLEVQDTVHQASLSPAESMARITEICSIPRRPTQKLILNPGHQIEHTFIVNSVNSVERVSCRTQMHHALKVSKQAGYASHEPASSPASPWSLPQ